MIEFVEDLQGLFTFLLSNVNSYSHCVIIKAQLVIFLSLHQWHSPGVSHLSQNRGPGYDLEPGMHVAEDTKTGEREDTFSHRK